MTHTDHPARPPAEPSPAERREAPQPPHVPSPPRFGHRPALDALRGLAVLIVVAFHSELGFAKGGYLGVSTFFTLSGFLITTLVLVEHSGSGRLDLRAFWRRRFRRLLPAAVVAIGLVVVLVAVIGDPSTKASIGGDAASSVFYIANWHLLWSGTSYAQLFVSPSPLLHMWSLAVEEQFYVVFPLVVAVLIGWRSGRRSTQARLSLRARLGLFAGITIVLSAIEPALFHFGIDRTYYGTDTRAAEIAVGILLAVLAFPTVAGASVDRPMGRTGRRVLAVISTVAFVSMAAAWASIPETSPLWRDGGFVLYALGSAALVAAGVYVVGPVARLAWLRPLVRLGVISYAVYLVHWPILWVIDLETNWSPLLRFVVTLAASVAVAEVSLRLLERPIRRTGRVAGVPALAAVPVVALLAVVGSVLVTRTAPPPVIDYASAADSVNAAPPPTTQPQVTVPGETATTAPRELQVAFFGDSTALMTAAGFKTAAENDPRVGEVPGKTRLGCGIVLAERTKGVDGRVGSIADICDHWPEEWAAQIAENRPDVAVVMAGPWETFDFQFAGVDGWHHLGDPVADEQIRALLQQAVDELSVDGARVALVTTSHVDRRKPGPGPCACPERLDRWNELLREVAAANPGTVSIIDLEGWLTSVGPAEDEHLRLDGVHFSEETAAEVSERWLIDQVLALPRNSTVTQAPTTTTTSPSPSPSPSP
jgi:peptidoglycan/LPS O-acetylase OafA/YrhL